MPDTFENVSSNKMTTRNTLIARLSIAFGQKWLKIIVSLLEITFVLLLGYLASGLVTNFLSPARHSAPVVLFKNAENDGNNAADFLLVKQFDPFFRTDNVAPEKQIAAVKESDLQLEVFGLRAAADGQGNAIVKLQGAKQKLVKNGESIAPNIKLVAVYPDRIEISRRGIREAVYMYKNANKQRLQPQSSEKKSIRPVSKNIIDILSALKWEAVKENRRITGFRLKSVPNISGLDLQIDDVLRKINGAQINSYEVLAELTNDLQGVKHIVVEFDRRGERLTQTVAL